MARTQRADMATEAESLRGTILRAGRNLPEEELLRLADDLYALVRARRRDHEGGGPVGMPMASRWATSLVPEGGSFWAVQPFDHRNRE
ncbi:hypothetical protein PQ455_05940 [Sphingomonas naphthae]|uniref:Acyl-CoA carboxylase subunit epsilon n=1 Tax=Sphingomonas naphthae TaxID=1813468 RepID=A0ABY7TNI3_9SPHN|nr:hypothetical protein [Sphingomonas naphthae]WCT74764.1 hypothetical protein PQ455_05940 [Sphingomonas naphthae]